MRRHCDSAPLRARRPARSRPVPLETAVQGITGANAERGAADSRRLGSDAAPPPLPPHSVVTSTNT